MKINRPLLVAALALAAVLPWAAAQSVLPGPVVGASAPAAAKPGPRPFTPAEQRENATPRDESRPEGPVVPQISIPLGKSVPASSKPTLRAARPEPAASSGGVDDAVARCEAQADAPTRAKCRDRLSHQGTRR